MNEVTCHFIHRPLRSHRRGFFDGCFLLLPVLEAGEFAFFLADGFIDAALFSELNQLHEIRDVVRERPHGLQAFEVFFDVFLIESVDHVPVLRTGDDHVRHEEILVDALERGRVPAPAAGDDARPDQSIEGVPVGVEKTVEETR